MTEGVRWHGTHSTAKGLTDDELSEGKTFTLITNRKGLQTLPFGISNLAGILSKSDVVHIHRLLVSIEKQSCQIMTLLSMFNSHGFRSNH